MNWEIFSLSITTLLHTDFPTNAVLWNGSNFANICLFWNYGKTFYGLVACPPFSSYFSHCSSTRWIPHSVHTYVCSDNKVIIFTWPRYICDLQTSVPCVVFSTVLNLVLVTLQIKIVISTYWGHGKKFYVLWIKLGILHHLIISYFPPASTCLPQPTGRACC